MSKNDKIKLIFNAAGKNPFTTSAALTKRKDDKHTNTPDSENCNTFVTVINNYLLTMNHCVFK